MVGSTLAVLRSLQRALANTAVRRTLEDESVCPTFVPYSCYGNVDVDRRRPSFGASSNALHCSGSSLGSVSGHSRRVFYHSGRCMGADNNFPGLASSMSSYFSWTQTLGAVPSTVFRTVLLVLPSWYYGSLLPSFVWKSKA